MSTTALYYNPAKPSAFSTVNKLSEALCRKTKSDFRAWLEPQKAYTKHRHVSKPFVRNAYTVSKLLDVSECDLLEVQSLAIYNDIQRYIQSLIDVFFEISPSGARKDKERPNHHFRFSFPIS